MIHNFLLAKLYENDRQFFKKVVLGTASSTARLSKRPPALETLSEVCETAEECSLSPGTASASVPMSDSALTGADGTEDTAGAIDERLTASTTCTPAHRLPVNGSRDENGESGECECEQQDNGDGEASRRRSGAAAFVRSRSASEDSHSGGGGSKQRVYARRPKILVERARLERQSAVSGSRHSSRRRIVPAAAAPVGETATDVSDEGTHEETSYSSRSQSPAESDAEALV